MAQEAAALRERATADPERTPAPIPLRADARLRSWLAGDYGGYDEASLPHAPTMVLPATLVTPLGVYVSCSPLRPPALVMGPSGTYTRANPPSWCAWPRSAAYKLLGPVVSEIGGSIVGLEDIAGADARRLSERVQCAQRWEERGRLLDDFLLDRATLGPQPSPEVSHAWRLLARSRGRSTIREIARQVSWSHKHLITQFQQQIGVTPLGVGLPRRGRIATPARRRTFSTLSALRPNLSPNRPDDQPAS